MKTSVLMLRSCAALVLGLSSACRAEPERREFAALSAVERAKGIYVVVGPNGPDGRGQYASAAFTSPAAGVYVRTLWSTIEPGPDTFDWSGLDQDLAAAKRGNKRVSIGVRAGEGTPAWLLDKVPTVSFIVGRRRGTRGSCEPLRIASPWSAGYVDAYGRMVAALSDHLKAVGAYDRVSIIKLTGMNNRTEELHLPSSEPAERAIAAGTACRISDAAKVWQQSGYTPALALDAWKRLAGATNRAFPDKLLSLPIIGSNDFPRVDSSGNPVSKRSSTFVDVKQQIITAGLQMFPGRFAVQWNSLNDKRMSPALAAAQAQGAVIGMQSNLRRGPGGGAGCNLVRKQPGKPCTAEGYRALLTFGERSRAAFLEIWPVDAARFGPQIAESARTFE